MVIANLFPKTYCLFEKVFISFVFIKFLQIHLMQLVYLLIFNCVCTYSRTFGVDDHKQKIGIVRQIIQNQTTI